jgi:integrase
MLLIRKTITGLSLPKGKTEAIFFDDDIGGLGIRIRSSGSRVWIFQYDNAAGRTRRMTLGKVSAIDITKARQIASELHAKVRLGQDPAAAKAQSAARAAETFGAVLPTYLAWHRARVRPSTFRHTERHLGHNLAPLHSLPINQVDRRAISAQLQRMVDSPVQANRTRSTLSAFLNWCLREGLVESNAALATNKNIERARERVLTDAELRNLWLALPEGDFGDILKILILTGQRAHEISDVQWSEINFEKGVIELPAHRTKNRRKHTIPMSPMVRTILQGREQNGDFVFGITGASGFSGWSRCKERLDKTLGIPEWAIHDLRRTFATGAAEIGIPPHIIEAILNHVSGHKSGVAGIYNRAAYESEKTTALIRWGEHVAAVVEDRPSNVKSLRKQSIPAQ